MSETTINVRQENPEQTENMAKLESPDDDVYGYLDRKVSGQLGEFMELVISEGDDASLDTVTGSNNDGNYARYETPGGNVKGLGISLDVVADVFGIEIERGDNGTVQNAPESVGLGFAPSDESAYEDAAEADEEEAEALLADAGSDDAVETEEPDEEEEAEELLAEAEEAA